MPGIIGIVLTSGRESLQPALTGMSRAISFGGKGSLTTWMGTQTGLAVAGPGSEAMLAASEGAPEIVLAVTGQIYPDRIFRERLKAIKSQHVPKGTGQPVGLAQQLLGIYQKLGPGGLQGLNGAYVVVVWESQLSRLTLISDRGGLQPFYFWQTGKRLVFASRIQAIMHHPAFSPRVNPTALFDLLAAEQMLDERTLLYDVQSLPPAGWLTYENGRLDVRSYWQPVLYARGGAEPTEGEAIEGLAGQVLSAVRLLLDYASAEIGKGSGASLLLTGGLDSRLLAGALARNNREIPIRANTIGHEQARDVRYGREIALAAGLPYTGLPANPHYLDDYSAEYVRRTEGGSNVHASWILEELDYLAQSRTRAIFTGVGAEAVSGRHWLSDQTVNTRQEALARLCELRWTYSSAAKLLRPEIRVEAWQASRESLRRTLDEAPADNLLGWSDYFAYRQNRRHPTGNVLSDNVMVLEPFFENELVDYAYRLPPALRKKGQLYIKMIIQEFPEMARIGFTDSGRVLAEELHRPSTGTRLGRHARDLGLRIWNRLGRSVPSLRNRPYGDNPAQAIYYNYWLRTAQKRFVIDLLRQEEYYEDFLDVFQVHRLVDEHMAGRTDAFRLVDAVVTFVLWRQMTERSG